MGAFNMQLVMESLDGVPLSLPWGVRKVATRTQKVGDPIIRDFDAEDMALLLSIAYRQRDREYVKVIENGKEIKKEKYPDVTPICYGSRKILMKMSHLRKHKLDGSRRFLVESGLITYNEKLYTRDVKHPEIDRMKTYKFVYQLNEDKLAACKIKAKKRTKEDEENDDATPSGGSGFPLRGREGSPSGGTKITKRERREKDSNKGAGGAENDKSVLRWQEFIATSFGVDIQDVGMKSIREKVLDKDPKEVIAIIREVSANKNQHKKPIGFMFFQIGNLPKVDYTPEEMEAQFGEARKLPAAKPSPADESIENGWNRLVADLGLGELSEKEIGEAKSKFDAMLKSRPGEEKDVLQKLRDDLPSDNGCADFAEMQSRLTPPQRIAALITKCEKLTV